MRTKARSQRVRAARAANGVLNNLLVHYGLFCMRCLPIIAAPVAVAVCLLEIVPSIVATLFSNPVGTT
jgi:hypothetical protein